MNERMRTYATAARLDLYRSLADAFVEPHAELVHAGNRWKVYHAALEVAQEEKNSELHHAALALALIPSTTLSQRREHYHRFISSAHYPLHESLARGERLGGVLTLAVWTVYRSLGLQVAGALSPDYVSVELTFLSHLLAQELIDHENAVRWKQARKLFVKRHVGQWLPRLGDALDATDDPIYAPLGQILAIVIRTEAARKKPPRRRTNYQLPVLKDSATCNLCNFCVQTCPSRALSISEDASNTTLMVNDMNCLSCKKCVAACPTNAIELTVISPKSEKRTLYTSSRCCCLRCGSPTVSQAELNAIVKQIGNPAWLNYCSDCRSIVQEVCI